MAQLSNPVGSGDMLGELTKGVPMWIRAAAILGAPTVAAGYLIWLVSGALATDVRAMRDSLTVHTVATGVLADKITYFQKREVVVA